MAAVLRLCGTELLPRSTRLPLLQMLMIDLWMQRQAELGHKRQDASRIHKQQEDTFLTANNNKVFPKSK